MKIVKYIKNFKIKGTSCYDINVTCIQSPTGDLLKSLKFKLRASFSVFTVFEKKGW